uniref:Uncharacterized protein n=1 Tax=Arundo donax TaxID=35708 RepID=A0A0A9BV99_ARUDO
MHTVTIVQGTVESTTAKKQIKTNKLKPARPATTNQATSRPTTARNDQPAMMNGPPECIYSQRKSLGQPLPQLLRITLRSMGRLRLIPSTLALMAVHRQSAASRSTSPSSSEQHGSYGGEPILAFTRPSTLAHTPSFSASLGHDPWRPGFGVGGFGAGGGGQ